MSIFAERLIYNINLYRANTIICIELICANLTIDIIVHHGKGIERFWFIAIYL